MMEQDSLMIDLRQQAKNQTQILKAIQQYQNIGDHQDEQSQVLPSQNKQTKNDFNLQNKKILKIQPYNMHKDQITLLKQNREKKERVKTLERLNNQLRKQYESCLENNAKIQQFLKDREFTFQMDHKMLQGNKVMLKAKRTLYDQAKETKEKIKKMFKDRQVSAIQQIKNYINVLETHQKQILRKTNTQKQTLMSKYNTLDLSEKQLISFQKNSQKLQVYFTSNIEYIKQRYQDYKKQRLTVRKCLRKKEIQQKTEKIKQYKLDLARLMQQSQGLQYQNKLLGQRLKDYNKQTVQYQSLKQKVQYKGSIIQKLQRQLRQKIKTYEYMQQWTKQLKNQLEQRKIEHANKKQEYQQKINVLSQNYEKYNQIYKANLYEQQIAKKKGIKDIQIYNNTKVNTHIKPINFEEIRIPLKCLSFLLLANKVTLQLFIDKMLKNQEIKNHFQKENRSKFKVKSAISIQKNIVKENITFAQMVNNFQASQCHMKKEDITKIARFVIQDGNGKMDQQNGINRTIAKQILRKILERELDTKQKIIEAKAGLLRILSNYSQGIRHQLKIAGGKQQQINILVLRKIFINYGAQPYLAYSLSELLQLYGWTKRRNAGFVKLQDYDQVLVKINTSKYGQFLLEFTQ